MDKSANLPSKTFIIGAGFSAFEQFPLVFGLRERIVHFLEAERHSAYKVFLQPGNGGFTRGQFYAGLEAIDPAGSIHFEETLIALSRRLASGARSGDPCYVTRKLLEIGCARLLWCMQSFIWRVSDCYRNIATWTLPTQNSNTSNIVVSFNWDLLVERALTDGGAQWSYSITTPSQVSVLKPHGSINWSRHLQKNLRADYSGWQRIGTNSNLCYDANEPLSNPNKQEINSDLRYMIFPSDPELPTTDADVKLLWEEASQAIAERESVVFIGYSLPAYDSYALKFFKRALQDKRIEVYNPSSEHLARFREVFGDAIYCRAEKFEECIYSRPRPA